MIQQMTHPDVFVSIVPDILLVVACAVFFVIAIHACEWKCQDCPREDFLQATYYPLRTFYKDSRRLLKRCTKPNKQEFTRMCTATAIGFALMGSIGFAVKLIHIPINNIIVS